MQTKLVLHSWQEVLGTVDGVEIQIEKGVLKISLVRRIGLEIPLIEIREGGANLVQLTGQNISILRTGHDYILKRSKLDARTQELGSLRRV